MGAHGPVSAAFESTAVADKPQVIVEFFAGVSKWQTEDQVAEAMGGKKKKGRLGRMTYSFKTADTLNRNRRIYPKDVMEKAVAELSARIDKKCVYGRLDHPDPYSSKGGIVTLNDAAVMLAGCKMDGNEVEVVFDMLDNPHGHQLMSILECDGNPGVSQRGYAEWREPTDAEREKYGIPEGQYVDVAEWLRLITYDVVSEPGFADANNATVTEQHQSGANAMTLEELKAKFPHLYNEAVAQGRAAAEAEMAAKIEKAVNERKPQIASEAVATVQKDLDTERAKVGKLTKALEAVKPLLVEHGIVNEQITDAQAAAKIVTLEGQLTAKDGEIKVANDKLAALQAQVNAAAAEKARADAIAAVQEAYKNDARLAVILESVKLIKPNTKEQALEFAKTQATMLETAGFKPNHQAPKINTPTNPNPQNPGGGASNEQVNGGLPASAFEGVRNALLNGVPAMSGY